MTTRDFPVRIVPQVERAWMGEAFYEAFLAAGERMAGITETPLFTLPDRRGGFGVDPDDHTKRWEWDVDLTTGEAEAFDDILKAHGGDTDGVPGEAGVAAAIDTMKAFRTRGGTPTDAQRDATIDAIIDFIRFQSQSR